jgi:hypothetical protein
MTNNEISAHLKRLLGNSFSQIKVLKNVPADGVDNNDEEVYVEKGTLCGFYEVVSEQFRMHHDKLRRVLCKCHCGTLFVVRVFDLLMGNRLSCNCQKNMLIKRGITRGVVSPVNWTYEDMLNYLDTGSVKSTFTPYKGDFGTRFKERAKKELKASESDWVRWSTCCCGRVFMGSSNAMCDYCTFKLERSARMLHNGEIDRARVKTHLTPLEKMNFSKYYTETPCPCEND